MDTKGPLAGREALVLGGTGGIGWAMARALAGAGAGLFIQGRRPDRVNARLAELKAMGAQVRGIACSIESPSAFLEALPADFEPTILVPCFGPFIQKPIAAHSPQDWERIALLDLALPGAIVSHFLPTMVRSGYGRIVLFGGTRTDGIRGFRTNGPYAAAKTALSSLVKSIAAEHARDGVAAIVLCPGFVDTEYLPEGEKASLASLVPGGRLIRPEEIAGFALSMILEGAVLANGSSITLDNGLRSF